MPELDARGLVLERGGQRVLDGVDLRIEAGEVVAIMGPTGAGKSSLALALAGVLDPVSGLVSGTATDEARLMLQRPESTFLAETVLEEVTLAGRWAGAPREAVEPRAMAALAELGLPADVAGRDPLALSGGEQRRVAIAAVLATGARVTILDEPGAGLDPAARRELHEILRRMHAAGRTLVLVTHDPAEAAQLATRLVVLNDGRVVWDGGVGGVLGDPARAVQLGLDVAPEVRILHAVAAGRGATAAPVARPADAVWELERVLRTPAASIDAPAPPPSEASGSDTALRQPLPRRVDTRVRLVACALAVAAALLSQSILAAAAVATACAVVVAFARVERTRVRIAVRPLLALAILLVLLEFVFGRETTVQLLRGTESAQTGLAALLRALQATGVVLATLALSAATATTDLAAGIRSLLAPLRLLRVPVGSIAFVLATGLGLVPALADELERLRIAQRARGMRPRRRGMIARLRADALLLTPLFVAAFRRAHLLADALAVRGFDPTANMHPWRPRTVPPADLLLLVGSVALLVVARFA